MTLNLKAPELRELKPRILVCGVGGAGGNAVNNMIVSGLPGVEFIVANTDAQALTTSKADRIVQMGLVVTEGLGAGSKPEVGRAAAEEAISEIRDHLSGAHMVFVTAGMGGGTGTGAAPVIARTAREMGILTVGVVTKPFQFEGQRRMRVAESGIEELQAAVDTLIVIPNQNLFRVANEKTTFADAFAMADQVLYSGVACITDLMVKEGLINLDFADVRAIMAGMGKAMMGTGESTGERRAMLAAEAAIANPLLDETTMKGARGLLISITGGNDLTLYEVDEAASRIRQEVDEDANIILGATYDQSLDGIVRVSVVATGIEPLVRPNALPVTNDGQPLRMPERFAQDFDAFHKQAQESNAYQDNATYQDAHQSRNEPDAGAEADTQAFHAPDYKSPDYKGLGELTGRMMGNGAEANNDERNYPNAAAPAANMTRAAPRGFNFARKLVSQNGAVAQNAAQAYAAASDEGFANAINQQAHHQAYQEGYQTQSDYDAEQAYQSSDEATAHNDYHANQGSPESQAMADNFVRAQRMPKIEDLPTPAQRQIRAQQGQPAHSNGPEARRKTLLEKLASFGMNRQADAPAQQIAASAHKGQATGQRQRPMQNGQAAAPYAAQQGIEAQRARVMLPRTGQSPFASNPPAAYPAQDQRAAGAYGFDKGSLDQHGRIMANLAQGSLASASGSRARAIEDEHLEIPAFLRRKAN